jgi:hypothetical protein
VAENRTRLVTDTAQTPFEYSQWSEVQTACGTVYAGYLTTPHPAVGDPPAKGTVKYAHPRVRLPSKVTDLADGTVSTERDGWIDFLDNGWQEWTLEDDTAYLQRLSDLRTDRDRTIHARSKARDSEGMDVCACSYDGGATTTYSYKYAVEPQNDMPQWKPSGPHAVCAATGDLSPTTPPSPPAAPPSPSPLPPPSPSPPPPPVAPIPEGRIRLEKLNNPHHGGWPYTLQYLVEVFHGGEWGTVCMKPKLTPSGANPCADLIHCRCTRAVHCSRGGGVASQDGAI